MCLGRVGVFSIVSTGVDEDAVMNSVVGCKRAKGNLLCLVLALMSE